MMDGYGQTILVNTCPNFALRGVCPYGDNVGCCVEDRQFSSCTCGDPPDPYENFMNSDNFASLGNLEGLEDFGDFDQYEGFGV